MELYISFTVFKDLLVGECDDALSESAVADGESRTLVVEISHTRGQNRDLGL